MCVHLQQVKYCTFSPYPTMDNKLLITSDKIASVVSLHNGRKQVKEITTLTDVGMVGVAAQKLWHLTLNVNQCLVGEDKLTRIFQNITIRQTEWSFTVGKRIKRK